MHRINHKHPPEISSQEYIRKVQEDAGEEFSLDFLRRDGVLNTTPLSAVKKYVNAERIDKVVAIVKSYTPNGLGDMMITLKDPTDTIGASVHGKILSVGDFGKLITVGSVLILQKVVAFSSSCMSSYLNITRNNIDKVISVDCEVQIFPDANADNTQVFSTTSVIPERTPAPVPRRAEGFVGYVHRGSSLKGKAVNVESTQKENYTLNSSLNSGAQIENAAHKGFKEPIHIDPVYSGPSNWQGDNSSRSSEPGPGTLEAIFRNFQDLDNSEEQGQLGELGGDPCNPSTIENLDSRNWRAESGQAERLLQFKLSASEKLTQIVHASVGTSSMMPKNVQKEQQPRVINSAPGLVENLAKRDLSAINGGLKSVQQTETGSDSNVGAHQDEVTRVNVVKKQRLGLVSRTAVQEWTDEQLCILDMDED